MNISRTHIQSAAGTALMALFLTACGSTAAQPTSGSSAPTTAATTAAATTAPTTAPTIAAATIAPTTAAATTAPTTAAATTAPTTAAATTAPTTAAATTAPAAGAPAATVDAEIKTFLFKPDVLEVKVGTEITWTNKDDIDHSVTHGTSPDPGGAFDSDFFAKDKTYSHTFDKAGEFPYFCKRHPSMTGMVKVSE